MEVDFLQAGLWTLIVVLFTWLGCLGLSWIKVEFFSEIR